MASRLPSSIRCLIQPFVLALGFALSGGGTFAADGFPHWSLEPFRLQPLPKVARSDWPASRVDYFILRGLEQGELTPSADADKATLLRRVTFDLIGLPPSADEMAAFEVDAAPDAYLRVVDRLLSSPEYGARWGRHWLDVARYAETSGNVRNMSYPLAWRYRNWVIRAFNANTPFDHFVRQQIAGDLLAASTGAERDENLLGTGFLAIGVKTLGEQNLEQYELNVADDQIDATTRAFLGLSAGCARCHDHKFDPIPTREYYALAGIFRSTRLLSGVETNNRMEEGPAMPLGPGGADRLAAVAQHEKELDAMIKSYTDDARKLTAMRDELTGAGLIPVKATPPPAVPKEMADKLTSYGVLQKTVGEWQIKVKAKQQSAPARPPMGMAVLDKAKPVDCALYESGEVKKPQAAVPRGALTCLNTKLASIAPQESGRRQLADWIASPDNPLTARVIVNRVWQHLFGTGLVATPDDFGRMGARPTHPELLDDLSDRFVRDGWNVKGLIRELVMSRTYRMSSALGSAKAELEDPTNTLLHRMPRRPLEAEPLRDAMLSLGGRLERGVMEGSPVATLSEPVKPQGREIGRNGFMNVLPENQTHRSIYLPVVRGALTPALQCFDCADPNLVVGARTPTIVPTQSLFLMNSEFVMEQSRHLAKRILAAPVASTEGRIVDLWRLVFTRMPEVNEIAALRAQLEGQAESPESWERLCQVLMMTGEFRLLY